MDAGEAKKIREIEQCFYLNDYPQQGKIANEKLVKMMRLLGTNAPEDELPDIYKKIDPSGSGTSPLIIFREYCLVLFVRKTLASLKSFLKFFTLRLDLFELATD